MTLTGEYAFPKGVGFVADVEVGFNENIINLLTADSFLRLCHIMSIFLIYVSHCRRLFEALQCCTIAICCNFPHLRCEGDTRVVEEAIVLKGKVAPAENKNKII